MLMFQAEELFLQNKDKIIEIIKSNENIRYKLKQINDAIYRYESQPLPTIYISCRGFRAMMIQITDIDKGSFTTTIIARDLKH